MGRLQIYPKLGWVNSIVAVSQLRFEWFDTITEPFLNIDDVKKGIELYSNGFNIILCLIYSFFFLMCII